MSSNVSTVLSAQEQAIAEGKKVLHGTATDRVLRMFDAIRSYGAPRVTLERAVYFTKSFKRPFYETAIITCEALNLFARCYSELSAKIAAGEKDPKRTRVATRSLALLRNFTFLLSASQVFNKMTIFMVLLSQ